MAYSSTNKVAAFFKKIASNQLFIPLLALILLAVINLVNDPGFFVVTATTNNSGNTVFSGALITILDYGSELGILAIGMTLVTAASGGQDISVGATIAIAMFTFLLKENKGGKGKCHKH